MRSTRIGFALLVAPAAVMAGHALGYLFAGHEHPAHHAIDHGYLPVVASIAVTLFLGTLLWLFVSARCSHSRTYPWRGAPSTPSVRHMVGVQWVLFVSQEFFEHAAAGDASAVIRSPALWLGLVAQVGLAAAAVFLLGAADWAGGRVLEILLSHSTAVPSPPVWAPAAQRQPAGRLLFSTATSRGPPL